MLEAETFLPLDYIDFTPLKERLREFKDVPNVKLLYDVLKYEPLSIKKAVLYATNNALVCETADDAAKVAFQAPDGKRHDAVALDGTYYRKNGFISGGSSDLAKRWDDKDFHKLKGIMSSERSETRFDYSPHHPLSPVEFPNPGNIVLNL